MANQHFLKFSLGGSVMLRFTHVQCRPFTMLYLGSIGMDHIIGHCGELCYQLFAHWVVLNTSCCLLILFQIQLFLKLLSGIPSECQTVWIQIKPDILSGLVWVQTVCKYHHQTALVDKKFRDSYTKE